MATPHIAGLVAYLISRDGNDTPANLQAKIKSLATKNALSGIRKLLVVYAMGSEIHRSSGLSSVWHGQLPRLQRRLISVDRLYTGRINALMRLR